MVSTKKRRSAFRHRQLPPDFPAIIPAAEARLSVPKPWDNVAQQRISRISSFWLEILSRVYARLR